MTSDTSKLFADICKRGCIIETSTKYQYATENLPKCLVLLDQNFSSKLEFAIKSIIPNDNNVNIILYNMREYYCKTKKYILRFNNNNYNEILNYIIFYVHANDPDWIGPYCPISLPL